MGSRPTITLDDETDAWLREESDRRNVTLSTVVQDCIRAAAGSGTYGDEDEPVTFGELVARVQQLEAAVGADGEIEAAGDAATDDAADDGAAATDDQLRDAVTAVDWDAVNYARTDDRVAGVTAALVALRDGRADRTGDLREIVAEHVDVSNPGRLLSGVARQIDAVGTPPSGSDRYEWRGFSE